MTAIEKIQEKLQRYPALKFTIDGNTISVAPAHDDGFSVYLTERERGFTVGFDGWHEEFEDEEEALSAFAFGLSDECRLKVVQRGGADCSWTVEAREGDDWSGDSTTGLLLTPFWRTKRVVYRRNRGLGDGRV
jgi:hypothetical protein